MTPRQRLSIILIVAALLFIIGFAIWFSLTTDSMAKCICIGFIVVGVVGLVFGSYKLLSSNTFKDLHNSKIGKRVASMIPQLPATSNHHDCKTEFNTWLNGRGSDQDIINQYTMNNSIDCSDDKITERKEKVIQAMEYIQN